MSNKAPTEAIYRELRKKKIDPKERSRLNKEYQKKRTEKFKGVAWWVPK